MTKPEKKMFAGLCSLINLMYDPVLLFMVYSLISSVKMSLQLRCDLKVNHHFQQFSSNNLKKGRFTLHTMGTLEMVYILVQLQYSVPLYSFQII